MKRFREFLKRDVDRLLFNLDEAAQLHSVEGKEIPVIIDDARLTDLKAKSRYADGIGTAVLLIYIKAEDLGYCPANRSLFQMDQNTYRVVSVGGELVYEIILEENC